MFIALSIVRSARAQVRKKKKTTLSLGAHYKVAIGFSGDEPPASTWTV